MPEGAILPALLRFGTFEKPLRLMAEGLFS
jgi:hypothetical protein